MNIICSTVEATTSAAQLIGTCIGLLSIIWSHVSGIWHCAEGAIINPAISTFCGPICGGAGVGTVVAFASDFIGAIPGAIGTVIQSFTVK